MKSERQSVPVSLIIQRKNQGRQLKKQIQNKKDMDRRQNCFEEAVATVHNKAK